MYDSATPDCLRYSEKLMYYNPCTKLKSKDVSLIAALLHLHGRGHGPL